MGAGPQASGRRAADDAAQQVFDLVAGAMGCAMGYVGERLGLYKALADIGPAGSGELAERAGLHERWVREWLRQQSAAGLVAYGGDGRFSLPPGAREALADEAGSSYVAAIFASVVELMRNAPDLPEAFRTGRGMTYDELGPDYVASVERLFAPWFRNELVPEVLPRLDGVVGKLEHGGRAADIGCGAGVAVVEMARAFPRAEFHGYDNSHHAVARARANAAAAGVANAHFHDIAEEALPDDHRFDLVTTFNSMHDMPHPQAVARAIRKALDDDGTWFICEVNSQPSFAGNLAGNPLAAMLYGYSMFCCLPSGLTEPEGAGLGLLGFTEDLARRLAGEAGFMRFRRHETDSPLSSYFEVRP